MRRMPSSIVKLINYPVNTKLGNTASCGVSTSVRSRYREICHVYDSAFTGQSQKLCRPKRDSPRGTLPKGTSSLRSVAFGRTTGTLPEGTSSLRSVAFGRTTGTPFGRFASLSRHRVHRMRVCGKYRTPSPLPARGRLRSRAFCWIPCRYHPLPLRHARCVSGKV